MTDPIQVESWKENGQTDIGQYVTFTMGHAPIIGEDQALIISIQSKGAAGVSTLSLGEKEIVMVPETKFKVNSTRHTKGKIFINLEEK